MSLDDPLEQLRRELQLRRRIEAEAGQVPGQPGEEAPPAPEVAAEAAALAGETVEGTDKDQVPAPPVGVNLSRGDLDKLADYYHSHLDGEIKNALLQLGLREETLNFFRVGYDDGSHIGFTEQPNLLGNFFKGRIVFPITDPQGQVVDLLGMAVTDEQPRYKSVSGSLSLAFNAPILGQSDVIFICDGIVDALLLLQQGYPAIGLPGIRNFNPGWAQAFKNKDVFVVLEQSDVARRYGERIAAALSHQAREVFRVLLPEGVRSVSHLFVAAEHPAEVLAAIVNQALQEGSYGRFRRDLNNISTFLQEFTRRHSGQEGGISTGFKELDDLLLGGFHEGLYIIAGPPAVGKTTLLKQLADQVAQGGHPVLYVSLEMSAFELWCKSIARLAGVPVGAVLTGTADEELIRRAAKEYEAVAANLWTVEGTDHTTIEQINEYIDQTFNERGENPVVFIDYLQRLPPVIPVADRQAAYSQVVLLLKRLSRQHGCAVVAAFSTRHAGAEDGSDVFDENEEIAHTADVVAVLGRDRLQVVKNRNGVTDTVRLTFDRAAGRFAGAN